MTENAKNKKHRWQHGRPKLDPQLVRHFVLRLRVNEAELAAIQEKANEMHMPVSRWLRVAALARQLPQRPVAAVNLDMYSELARIGININQMLKLAHQGRLHVAVAPLEELEELLRKIKILLLGVVDDCQAD